MLIDTHAHMDYPDFDQDRDSIMARAAAAGVTEIISIGTQVGSSGRALELAATRDDLWATVGIHPNEAEEVPTDYLQKLETFAKNPRVVAIGEIGLDYYRLPERDPALDRDEQIRKFKAQQATVFKAQLELAVRMNLNVVIHQRGDSWDDLLAIIRNYTGKVRGVFHCFGGTLEQVEELMDLGHLVSFTGLVTFKNAATIHETVAKMPLECFMVETDCPYLAPDPYRGKRCEPAYTRLIADRIAYLRGTSVERIEAATTETARNFFNFRR